MKQRHSYNIMDRSLLMHITRFLRYEDRGIGHNARWCICRHGPRTLFTGTSASKLHTELR